MSEKSPERGPESRPEMAPPKQKQVDTNTARALGEAAIKGTKK